MESLRSALAEIRQNAMRSALTLTGIVLGSLALVVMSSVMDGVGTSVLQGFSDLGFDGVFSISARQPKTPQERLAFQGSRGLELRDIDALRERGREIAGASGRSETIGIVSGLGIEKLVHVIGVQPDYQWIRNRRPAEGRFISESDELTGARVCLLGSELRTQIFGREEALSRIVTLGGVRFEVIGVGRKLGNSWFREGQFREEMQGLTIPLSTLQREFLANAPVESIEVMARDIDEADAARAEVRRLMLAQHHGVLDFRLENLASEALRARDQTRTQLRSWRIVMLAVAGVTLLVGGVGLLSVLLISLAERTYEIGLRKAMGATNASIFALFLSESLLLATAGAALGIAGGIGVTMIASRGFKDGLPPSPGGVVVALAAALSVGLLFGVGPALRASRMSPVEALREKG